MARRWYIDECSPTRVAGWVDDDGPVEGIEIAINGRPVKRLTPTDYRKDLQDAGVGDGKRGFTLPIAHYLVERMNSVTVRHGGQLLHSATVPSPRTTEEASGEKRRGGTLIFATAFAGISDVWTSRYRRWLEAVEKSGLAFTQILLVDDGSPSLPAWRDVAIIRAGEPIPAASKLVLYHFDSNLGRISNVDYPGWYRSFCFAINYGAERGFDKIIHLESDAYVLSQRAVDYFNAADKGWTAMWAPRHDYAESGIQIIGRDALDAAVSFCRADYASISKTPVEQLLPFTKIEKNLIGDRYGEYLTFIPEDADYVMQASSDPKLSLNPRYSWWLSRTDNGGSARETAALEIYKKDADAGTPCAHQGIYYQDFFNLINDWLLPRTYFEIGTETGESLRRFRCDALCVDPRFQITENVFAGRKRLFFFQMRSEEFFSRYNLLSFFSSGIDVAFQDGLHHFEVLLQDFINTERYCHSKSLMILHDCLPLNERMAERDYRIDQTEDDPRTRDYWTGDVWRIIPVLKKFRPDLRVFFVDCPPTGLVLCSNLNPNSTALSDNYERILAEFGMLNLSGIGLHTLWRMFPMLDSAAIARQPKPLLDLLGL